MLKHIDPLLTPDLLWLLAAMGHGDDLALVDANFPGEAIAAETASGRLIRLPGLRLGAVARAILSVLPIDDFVTDPVRRMQMVDHPDQVRGALSSARQLRLRCRDDDHGAVGKARGVLTDRAESRVPDGPHAVCPDDEQARSRGRVD